MKKLLIPVWIIAICTTVIAVINVYRLQNEYTGYYPINSNVKEQANFKNMPDLPITSMVFKEQAHDFGVIPDDKKVYTQFEFTNTGKEPLIIIGAEGSCGCTVPSWPKKSIAPGDTGTIEVAFDPTGKSGEQSKIVTITANTRPQTTVITVKATIIKTI